MGAADASVTGRGMAEEHDPLEAAGAIITGTGFILIFLGAFLLGVIAAAFGILLWKMGEMRREFMDKIGALKGEIEEIKKGDAIDDLEE